MVRTLYLDHSIVSHEPWWLPVEQVVASREVRLALSLWNLFEIGAASNMGQRDRRLAFLEKLDPLWMIERRTIQKQEVERFLWRHKFGRTPRDMLVLTPSLSVVESFISGPQTHIGLTPRQFIRELDYNRLNPLKKLSPEAQTTLKKADPAALKRSDKGMFVGWVNQSIPICNPDGQPMTAVARLELAEFCYRRRAEFLAECPSMAVEDALTTDRTRDRQRKPTDSDGPDAQHTIAALPYCDLFFTRDGYQARSATVVRRMLKALKLAEICTGPDQLSEVASALRGTPG
jgi:hypothetical protein